MPAPRLRSFGALFVAGALLATGCASSSRPSSAVGAMMNWVAQLSAEYDQQWEGLVPAQQAAVPQATFALCNEETYVGTNVGNDPPSVIYLQTVAERHELLPLPGHPTPLSPATLVTSKIEVGKLVSTITLTWFDLNGVWRWALSGAAVAAYEATRCPTPASSGTPYVAPTPTTVVPTTVAPTVPLVAPANIRVQALNGLQVGPLAGDLNVKLKTDGYVTLNADNATSRVTVTSIYVLTAGFAPEAVALAHTLGLPPTVVVATTPPPASAPIPNYVLGHADLVVVIGSDLAASLQATP